MSDQTEGQVEATEAPEGVAPEAPEVAETPVTETPVEATEPEAPKPAPSKALIGRISKLTAERTQQAARIAELEAMLQRQAPAAPQGDIPQGQTPQMSPQDFEARVKQEADLRATQQRFTDRCNEIYNSAKAAHPDFDAKIADIMPLGGFTMPMVEAAMELDNPSEVLYRLAGDVDRFAEIASMTPVRQAAALAKFAAQTAPVAPKKSSAPPPVAPKVGGGRIPASLDLSDDNTDMRAWIEARSKQVKDAQKRGVKIY